MNINTAIKELEIIQLNMIDQFLESNKMIEDTLDYLILYEDMDINAKLDNANLDKLKEALK